MCPLGPDPPARCAPGAGRQQTQSENLSENLAVLCRVPLAGLQAEIDHSVSTSDPQTVAEVVDTIWTYPVGCGHT